MSSRKRHTPPPLWHPGLWPGWLLYGACWCIARLPTSWQWALGRGLGRVYWHVGRKRRAITLTNLRLCFPELTHEQRINLGKENFRGLGMSVMETLWTWLGRAHPDRAYLERFSITGLAHYRAALAEGRGVILIGAHLMAMDVIGPTLASEIDLDVIYRYNKNPIIERAMVRGRERFFPRVIEREDTRSILRSLRAGHAIWYAADQDYGRRHSVFADFFGQPAATISGTARLAAATGAVVLLFSHYRHTNSHTWSIHFSESFAGFPSGDASADARRCNAAIEAAVQRAPEQYLWPHRRFKTRPPGAEPVY